MVWKDLNGEGITGIILSYSIAWLFPPHVLLSNLVFVSLFEDFFFNRTEYLIFKSSFCGSNANACL